MLEAILINWQKKGMERFFFQNNGPKKYDLLTERCLICGRASNCSVLMIKMSRFFSHMLSLHIFVITSGTKILKKFMQVLSSIVFEIVYELR